MAQEVFLRTAAGIISADKFNDAISPFKPTRHMASAVFVREEQYLNATTSTSLGATSRFEVNKDGDYLDKVWLTVSMAALSKNAGASFARYCDWLGYALIKEFRAIYGPQILSRIHKEELFVWYAFLLRLLSVVLHHSVDPRKELCIGHRPLCIVTRAATRQRVLCVALLPGGLHATND